jgi:lipopolysaccharide export system permease protein
MGGMANSGELVAMRAAGMSPLQLLFAVFRAGLLLLLLVVAVGDLVGPQLEQWGQQMRLEKMNKQVTFRSRYGFWVKDGDTIVNIRRASPEGRLQQVRIYEITPDQRLVRLTHARRGEYRQGHWVLQEIRQSRLEEDRVESVTRAALDWETVVNPAMLSVALIKPYLMPVWELYAHVQALRRGGQRATGYAIAFWNKVATPITMLAMLLLAVPLVMSSRRSVNPGQRVLMGALLGASFYLLSRGFSYAVIVFDLPTISVALFPLVVLGLAFFGLLRGKRL